MLRMNFGISFILNLNLESARLGKSKKISISSNIEVAIAPPPSPPALQLADLLKQCSSWKEVEGVIASHPTHKTEAWHLLTTEEKARIKALKQQATEISALKVGARVLWTNCPGHLESFNPFTVRAVEKDVVWLDWIYHPVPRSKLILEE